MRALSHHAGTGLSSTRRYRFDDVEIDLDAREIVRSGERADVEAKVFDLIELLLLARGRALSKAELTSALWADRPVTDAALSQQLRKARRALGDDGDAQRVIRTVHGRGLRWVAEVSGITDEAAIVDTPMPPEPDEIVAPDLVRTDSVAPAPSRRRSWLGAAAIAVVLLIAAGLVLRYPIRAAGDPSVRTRIAVLPIADQTGEPDLAWTANGLMGLMTSLSSRPAASKSSRRATCRRSRARTARSISRSRDVRSVRRISSRPNCAASVRFTSSICISRQQVRRSAPKRCTAARPRRSRSTRSRESGAGSI